MKKTLLPLLLVICFALAACGTSRPTSSLPPQPPPATAVEAAPLKAPEPYYPPLDVRDDEVVWGTLHEEDEDTGGDAGEGSVEGSGADSTEYKLNAGDDAIALSPAETSASDNLRPRRVEPADTGEYLRPEPAEAAAGETSPADHAMPSAADIFGVGNSPPAGDDEAYKPPVAENGSYYGEISPNTGRPKTVHVRGYYRRDGTYVRGHYRSSPRRRN